MIKKIYNKILRKYRCLHRLGFHNKDCSRRLFTTKNKYICIVTGTTHTKKGLIKILENDKNKRNEYKKDIS